MDAAVLVITLILYSIYIIALWDRAALSFIIRILIGTFSFRCLPADIAIFGSCSDQAFECYDIIEGYKKGNTLKL